MDEKYCYLDDVLIARKKGRFDVHKYVFADDQNKIDPDRYCHELYKHLAAVFNENINHINRHIYFKKTRKIELIDEKRTYGSDYIGPSWNYARNEYDFTDLEIAKGLKETRVLGGHTLWPRKTNSINNAKGGNGIYDRIDLCLDEIKNAYLHDFIGEAKHKNQLWNVICEDKEWILLFGEGKEGFRNFIDFFLFNDYVTKDYSVISLSISNCQKEEFVLLEKEYNLIIKKKINTKNNCYLPGKQFGESLNEIQRKEKYKLYVDNCIYMIKKRTKRMLKLI